jgi:hypothetical protein
MSKQLCDDVILTIETAWNVPVETVDFQCWFALSRASRIEFAIHFYAGIFGDGSQKYNATLQNNQAK